MKWFRGKRRGPGDPPKKRVVGSGGDDKGGLWTSPQSPAEVRSIPNDLSEADFDFGAPTAGAADVYQLCWGSNSLAKPRNATLTWWKAGGCVHEIAVRHL